MKNMQQKLQVIVLSISGEICLNKTVWGGAKKMQIKDAVKKRHPYSRYTLRMGIKVL
jgi:hypothetical protein